MENYLHPDAIKAVRDEVDITFGSFDDVPALVAEAVHNASGADIVWQDIDDEKKKGKKISQAKIWLNNQAAVTRWLGLASPSDQRRP